jgi:hypothetical protein
VLTYEGDHAGSRLAARGGGIGRSESDHSARTSRRLRANVKAPGTTVVRTGYFTDSRSRSGRSTRRGGVAAVLSSPSPATRRQAQGDLV